MPKHVRPYHAGPKTLTEIIGHGIKVVSFGSTKLPIAYKLFKTEDILKLVLVTLEKHFLHYGARGSQYLYNSFNCGEVIYYITRVNCLPRRQSNYRSKYNLACFVFSFFLSSFSETKSCTK